MKYIEEKEAVEEILESIDKPGAKYLAKIYNKYNGTSISGCFCNSSKRENMYNMFRNWWEKNDE